MSVTETLGGFGSWELELRDTTPDYIRSQLGLYGHLVVVDGPVDVAAAGNALLAGARYAGVCRGKGQGGQLTRAGSGLLFWLGDEDGKGHTLLTEVSLTNATLAQVVTALMPPTVTIGTVHAQANPAARYTGKHQFQSRREALAIALAPFDAEIRINPGFTADVGTAAQLYNTEAPDRIIVRRGAGSDIDLTAVGGQVDVEEGGWDYSTDVTLVGEKIGTGDVPDETFAMGSASAPSVPYKDPQGAQVKFTRLISVSTETEGTIPATAQLQLNRFNRVARSVKVTADDFVTKGSFAVGDAVYVYDPDSDIVNPAHQVEFQAQVLHPDVVRVAGDTWPLLDGMTVAWRTDTGVWLDLTPWVVWENPSSGELTVGDLPKTLTKPGGNPVQDRVDAARPDARIPQAPTGLVLSTSSAINPKGTDAAIITADWLPVTQNTDNTTVALSHYEVQYRPTFRAPLWIASSVTADTDVDLPVVAALSYDVHVRAVSTGGKVSDWSTTATILSAADSSGPGTPSDPVVTPYLGILRAYWNGLTSVGGPMPADFNRVDVHAGTTVGFVASQATLVMSMSTAGYAPFVAPYGSPRYVRFIAYDHNGNPSAASATVAGTAVQAADGDISTLNVGKLVSGIVSADVVISGQFATALSGARRAMNAIGFQAWDAANNLLINLDGVNNLLTGIFKTALAGRRIEIGSGGALGEVNFYAPDGTRAMLRAYTEGGGVEAMQFGIPVAGTGTLWNRVNYNSDEWASYRAENHDFYFLSGGFFTVRETPNRGTTAVQRLLIDSNNFLYRDSGARARFQIVNATGLNYWSPAGELLFQIDDNGTATHYLDSPFSTQNGIVDFKKAAVTDASPIQTFVNEDLNGGGFNYYGGGFNTIQVLNVFGSGFISITASAFTVSSDADLKDEIVDADEDFLAMHRSTPVRRYRRKVRDGVRDGVDREVLGPVEIGLLAQEAPERIRGAGSQFGRTVDVYQMAAATWGGLREADARLDELDQRLARLEGSAA